MDALFPLERSAGGDETADRVVFRLERWGSDYLLEIFGGARHIGAVVFAEGAEIESLSRPGHREEKLARRAAAKIASHLDGALTVIAGIHYDSISREAIERIVLHCDRLGDEIAEQLCARRTEDPL